MKDKKEDRENGVTIVPTPGLQMTEKVLMLLNFRFSLRYLKSYDLPKSVLSQIEVERSTTKDIRMRYDQSSR